MTIDVTVTGAAGFIGRWVVDELLSRGYKVTGFDDLSNGSIENINALQEHDAFTFREGDIRDRDSLNSLIKGDTDACVHLAAEIDVQESLDDPGSHFETNVAGTEQVLEVCRKTDTRLGLVGTCMVYDMVDSEEGIDEDTAKGL